eukprot:3783922-Pyramimonas_sp.AAC.1
MAVITDHVAIATRQKRLGRQINAIDAMNMQREECPAAGTNAPGIVIVNCEVVVSCKCPPTQKRPRPTHHIHAAAFQCGTGTTVRSGTPLLLPLLRNCYGCTRRIGAYECSVVDHGLVNHGTIVCEYPLIAP